MVANTLGAIIGFVIACLLVALVRRIARRRAQSMPRAAIVGDATGP